MEPLFHNNILQNNHENFNVYGTASAQIHSMVSCVRQVASSPGFPAFLAASFRVAAKKVAEKAGKPGDEAIRQAEHLTNRV